MMRNKPGSRLASLEATLAELEAELTVARSAAPQLAHDAAIGGDKEGVRFQENRKALDELSDKREILTQAIVYEHQQLAAKARAKAEAERAAIRERALGKAKNFFLVDLPKQAQLLDAAIGQYHANKKTLNELAACMPMRQPLDTGWLLYAMEMRDAVNREIARLDATYSSEIDAATFPRASGLGLVAFSPAQIPALVDVARETFEGLKKQLDETAVFPETVSKDAA
jgi:hypothetical protein